MSFTIDTGPEPWEPVVYSAGLDTTSISYRGRGTDAERVHRKIICQIQEFEDAEKLDAHYRAESLIIDSLWLDYPQYAEAIDTAYEDHRMMLTGEYWSVKQLSANAEDRSPAEPGIPNAQHAQNGKDGNERKDDECIW